MVDINRRLFYSTFDLELEFFLGDILLAVGGALVFIFPPVALLTIALGLLLEFRVFHETIEQIEAKGERIEETESQLFQVRDEIFSTDSGLADVPGLTPRLKPIIGSDVGPNKALEDRVDSNRRKLRRLENEINDLEQELGETNSEQ